MTSERGMRDPDTMFTWGATVAAFLPRLYVAIAWPREPVWDGLYYDFGAKRIAGGFGYSADAMIDGHAVTQPWCHYPVGYSAFLGALYRTFGAHPTVATVANAVIGALLVAVVHRFARYATSPGRARVAAIITAVSPGLIIYSALLMTELLVALGIMTAGWLFVRGLTPPSSRTPRTKLVAGLLAGGVLGLTTLVRPQSLLCIPGLLLIAFDLERGPIVSRLRNALAPTAVAVAAALAVVAPWTVRNCRAMDGCAFVSTNAGWNLAIGAFPRATGRFVTLRAADGCPIVTGQVQQDRCWMNEGVRWIRQDPKRWLGLMPAKLSFTFDHESFPVGYLGEAAPSAWPEEVKTKGRDLLSSFHRILLAVAALFPVAFPLARRMTLLERIVQGGLLALALYLGARGVFDVMHPAWPLALFIPVVAALFFVPGAPRRSGVLGYLAFALTTVVVTHAVFFGEDRYHMVVTPALCLFAACALRKPRAPKISPAVGSSSAM